MPKSHMINFSSVCFGQIAFPKSNCWQFASEHPQHDATEIWRSYPCRNTYTENGFCYLYELFWDGQTGGWVDGKMPRMRGRRLLSRAMLHFSKFDVTVITNWLAYKYSSIDIANMETIINSLWRWREGTCAWFQRRRTTASSSPPRARRHRYALVGLWMKYAMTAPSDWAPRPSANSPTSRFSPPPGNTHTLIQHSHSLQHKKSFALASSPINSSFLSLLTQDVANHSSY